MKKAAIVILLLLLMGGLVYWLTKKKATYTAPAGTNPNDPTADASLPPNSPAVTTGGNPYHPGSIEYCLRMFANMTICHGLPPDSTFH